MMIGHVSESVKLEFRQLFVGLGKDTPKEDFERKLCIIRKRLFNQVQLSDLAHKNFFISAVYPVALLFIRGS